MSVSWVSYAQDTTTPAAGAVDAREAFRRGEAAYSAGNYSQAIREWNQAYSVDPRPRIQFNLSQAYERLGELEKAMEALRLFLDSGDPDDPMYSDANARLSALQQRFAKTGVMVNGGAEGGQILVDDKDWGRTPRPDKIQLAPGSHTLIVRWSDRPEFRTSVVVPAGQVVEVNIPDSEPTGAATQGASEPTGQGASVRVDSDGAGSNKMLWYAVGGSVAAVGIAGLVYGVVRGGEVVDCKDVYCPDPGESDSASTQSIVGYVGGGLLLAGGATLIVLTALRGGENEDEQAARTQCGVGLASATCRFKF
jgi:hypothetical protein